MSYFLFPPNCSTMISMSSSTRISSSSGMPFLYLLRGEACSVVLAVRICIPNMPTKRSHANTTGHVRLERQVALLADGPADEDLASGHRDHLAGLLVELLGGPSHDADITGLRLAARVGTTRPMDPERLLHLDALVEQLGDPLGGSLGVDDSEWAELGTRAYSSCSKMSIA